MAKRGRDVALLEKATHPRFHIDESLLPRNTVLFEKLGVREQVAAIGVHKTGAEFVSDATGQRIHFEFAHGLEERYTSSWQVRRSQLDELLFRNAAARSAQIVENTRAIDVASTGNSFYRTGRGWGEGYMTTGDAFGFVDPMFSSGVLLAMTAGDLGADVADMWLDNPAAGRALAKRAQRDLRGAMERISWLICRINTPALRHLFIGPKNALRMQDRLVSLLAGNLRGNWNAVLAFMAVYYAVALGMRLGLHSQPPTAPTQLAAAE